MNKPNIIVPAEELEQFREYYFTDVVTEMMGTVADLDAIQEAIARAVTLDVANAIMNVSTDANVTASIIDEITHNILLDIAKTLPGVEVKRKLNS